MPTPNGGLITETNRQYYEGAQGFQIIYTPAGGAKPASWTSVFTTTFNTDLIFGSWDQSEANYALNNFKLYWSLNGLPDTWEEIIEEYAVVGNTITYIASEYPSQNSYLVVQLKVLDGGNYGDHDAYGQTVENNYNSYSYISLNDIVNNFMVAYVGQDKLIPSVKRTDVIFHAKRSLQEFSYDTLKSIKSQELNIPPSLSIVIPQDYVNYVKLSWIDEAGVKHPMFPTNNITISPYENPIQDNKGVPMQDNFDANVEGTSMTEERWKRNSIYYNSESIDVNLDGYNYDQWGWYGFYGRRYGIDPQYANMNGYFNINDREGKISFSSEMVGRLIVLEYISDGLAYDMDTRVPKLAEEAMYAHIIHAILALRINQPEYIIQRFKQEKSAKLRNAKIRLSNIKLDEIVQVLRGQSKWIKH
jgi:hypothetical protein